MWRRLDLRSSLCFDIGRVCKNEWRLVDNLKKRTLPASHPMDNPDQAGSPIADALVFAGFLLLSVLAIAAVAVATPVVLALSALAGLFEKNGGGDGWRSARA
jgi:hypothetical protein